MKTWILCALAIGVLVGCQNTSERVPQDSQTNEAIAVQPPASEHQTNPTVAGAQAPSIKINAGRMVRNTDFEGLEDIDLLGSDQTPVARAKLRKRPGIVTKSKPWCSLAIKHQDPNIEVTKTVSFTPEGGEFWQESRLDSPVDPQRDEDGTYFSVVVGCERLKQAVAQYDSLLIETGSTSLVLTKETVALLRRIDWTAPLTFP